MTHSLSILSNDSFEALKDIIIVLIATVPRLAMLNKTAVLLACLYLCLQGIGSTHIANENNTTESNLATSKQSYKSRQMQIDTSLGIFKVDRNIVRNPYPEFNYVVKIPICQSMNPYSLYFATNNLTASLIFPFARGILLSCTAEKIDSMVELENIILAIDNVIRIMNTVIKAEGSHFNVFK